MKRRLARREKFLLYLTIAAVGFTLVFNFVLTPILSYLGQMRQDLAKKEYLFKKYSRLTAKGDDLASLYDAYRDSLQGEDDPEKITNSLFEEIKNAAARFSLKVDKIKPLTSEEEAGYRQALLEVELVGNFASIFKFIKRLEELPVFIRVASFRLSPQAGTQAGQLRLRLTLARLFF